MPFRDLSSWVASEANPHPSLFLFRPYLSTSLLCLVSLCLLLSTHSWLIMGCISQMR